MYILFLENHYHILVFCNLGLFVCVFRSFALRSLREFHLQNALLCKAMEKLAKLKTVFKPDGSVTAGTSSQERSAECTNCIAGRYTATDGSTNPNCDVCPGGTYSIERASGCTNCSKGQFSEAESSACTNCEPGRYQSKVGFRGVENCTQCDFGTYSAIGAAVGYGLGKVLS